jgi:hypothetical protein
VATGCQAAEPRFVSAFLRGRFLTTGSRDADLDALSFCGGYPATCAYRRIPLRLAKALHSFVAPAIFAGGAAVDYPNARHRATATRTFASTSFGSGRSTRITTACGPTGLQRSNMRAEGNPAKIQISGTPDAAAACWPAES